MQYSYAQDYQTLKRGFEGLVGLSGDSVHILGGLVAMLVIAAILRTPIARIWPVLGVCVLQAANETFDALANGLAYPEIQGMAAVRDTVLTVSLPILLFILTRYFPNLFVRQVTSGPPLLSADDDETAVSECLEDHRSPVTDEG